jgi:hypothetical protein
MSEVPRGRNLTFEYDSLEQLVHASYGDLTAIIDENLSGFRRNSAFIDESLEQAYPELIRYTNLLTRLFSEGIPDAEAERTSYRAFHFACMVGTLVLDHYPEIDPPYYFDTTQSNEEIAEKFHEDLHVWLGQRPMLDVLIFRYMDSIDPSSSYSDLGELVAASTLMAIDNREKSRAADVVAAAFADEVEAWDGIIADD